MFEDSQGSQEEDGHIKGFIKLFGASVYIFLGHMFLPFVEPLRRIQYGIWQYIEPAISSRGWVLTLQESVMSTVFSVGIIGAAVEEWIKGPLRSFQRRALVALIRSIKDDDDISADDYPVK